MLLARAHREPLGVCTASAAAAFAPQRAVVTMVCTMSDIFKRDVFLVKALDDRHTGMGHLKVSGGRRRFDVRVRRDRVPSVITRAGRVRVASHQRESGDAAEAHEGA